MLQFSYGRAGLRFSPSGATRTTPAPTTTWAIRLDDANTVDSRTLVISKLGDLDAALADYDKVLSLNLSSLYRCGIVTQKKGGAAGSEADITAAKAVRAVIADEWVK